MKILFDQGTPVPLKEHLPGHDVATVFERGWSTLQNGKLLAEAERQGFEILITTDSHLKAQQNLSGRKIAVIVLLSASWPKIQPQIPAIVSAVETIAPGTLVEIEI